VTWSVRTHERCAYTQRFRPLVDRWYSYETADCPGAVKVAHSWSVIRLLSALVGPQAVSVAFLVFIYSYAALVCFVVPFIAYHVSPPVYHLPPPIPTSVPRSGQSDTHPWQVSGPAYAYQMDKGEHLELEVPVFLRKHDYDEYGMNMAGGEHIPAYVTP
jgi:hypothetical protein